MNRDDLIKHWDVIEAYKNGADIEYYSDDAKIWVSINSPSFYKDCKYRIKLVKDIVPWDGLKPKFKWFARDEDGRCFVFIRKPTACLDRGKWFVGDGGDFALLDNGLFHFSEPTTHWKDSLQERPQ